jgi:GTP-binding protein
VHLIDTSDSNADDPVHSFEIISGELAAFSESLMEKPMIVVATKLDATTDRTRLEALREFCAERELEFHSISAATGEGVKELVRSIADALDKIPRAPLDLADSHEASPATETGEDDSDDEAFSAPVNVDRSAPEAEEDENS